MFGLTVTESKWMPSGKALLLGPPVPLWERDQQRQIAIIDLDTGKIYGPIDLRTVVEVVRAKGEEADG